MNKPIFCSEENGFTLLELSVVLVITSLMLVGALQAFQIYNEKQKIERMGAYVVDVTQTLKDFPNVLDPDSNRDASGNIIAGVDPTPFGRMPCPAPLDGSAYGGAYAMEQNPPNCDGTLRVNTPDGDVYIGKLPTGTLRVSNDYMRDAFDNYVLYAVSASAVDQASYNTQPGAITIREKEMGNTGHRELARKRNIQYALISLGSNGIGALDFNGNVINNCDPDTDESENCIFSSNPGLNDAEFLVSIQSDNFGDDVYYDDYISYEASLPRVDESEEPVGCEQMDSFEHDGDTCPDGWTKTGEREEGGADFNLAGMSDFRGRQQYYNIDEESGDYYFTSFRTPETRGGYVPKMNGGQVHTDSYGIKSFCSKSSGNKKKTKCFSETIDHMSSSDVADPCPDGWRPIKKKHKQNYVENNSENGHSYVGTTYTTTCGR